MLTHNEWWSINKWSQTQLDISFSFSFFFSLYRTADSCCWTLWKQFKPLPKTGENSQVRSSLIIRIHFQKNLECMYWNCCFLLLLALLRNYHLTMCCWYCVWWANKHYVLTLPSTGQGWVCIITSVYWMIYFWSVVNVDTVFTCVFIWPGHHLTVKVGWQINVFLSVLAQRKCCR